MVKTVTSDAYRPHGVDKRAPKCLQIGQISTEITTPSLTVNRSKKMYPFVPEGHALALPDDNIPANAVKADARIRTADPFITREGQVADARPLAGPRGHVLAGN